MPNSTKSDAKKRVIIIWLAKVTFAFLGFAPRALERSAAYTYSHSNDEIKNVIGKTVTAAIASEPIHCPTNMVSTSILTDMNKIDRSWSSLFYEEFFISSVPSSSAETAIYTFVFSTATHSVIHLLTVAHHSSPSFKHGTAKNSSAMYFKFVISFHCDFNVSKQSETKAGVTTANFLIPFQAFCSLEHPCKVKPLVSR
jgi:hypothetical protein